MGRLLLVALFCCVAGAGPAVADVASDLRAIRVDIQRAEAELGKGPPPAPDKLHRAIAVLSEILDGRELNDIEKSIVRHYRAKARWLVNSIRLKTRLPIDIAEAQAALADFDAVIAKGMDIPSWGVLVADAMYVSGGVAGSYLKSPQLAYSYYDRCARLDHMGCVNVVAGVHLTGKWGQKANIAEALNLHWKVYITGTRYTCAGAFSARSIALIGYFTGTKHGTDDELAWFARANALLDMVAKIQRNTNPCDRAWFEIHEYLLRLSRGERATMLLQSAIGRSGEDVASKAIVALLRGEGGDELLFKLAASLNDKYDSCRVNFAALWHAKINGDDAMAQRHHRALREIGGDECATELTYAKKYGF